jgi:hypothetical protein
MEEVLKDLGEKLFGGFEPNDGLTESELASVEGRLNIRLPVTLRTLYLLVGKNRIITRAHNRFLRPREVRNDALIFLEQNQKVMFWGILLSDLHKDDPPVQQGNYEEDKWYLDAYFLSAFLLGMACWQAANGLPWTGQGNVDDQLMKKIRAELTYADPHVEDEVNDLIGYYGKDLVCCISRSAQQFLVGAKERNGLEQFENRFATSLDYL